MKRVRRFPLRLIRLTSLSVCFALLLSALTNNPVQSKGSKKPIERVGAKSEWQSKEG